MYVLMSVCYCLYTMHKVGSIFINLEKLNSLIYYLSKAFFAGVQLFGLIVYHCFNYFSLHPLLIEI